MPGKSQKPAGSLKTGEPAFLAVGKIRRPHGVRGDTLVELYTDFPERLTPGRKIYLGESHQPVTIRSQRQHNAGLILGFEGIDTPEQVGQHRNQFLYVDRSDAPSLPSGEYYFHELIDLLVVDEQGGEMGVLTGILETGANDVYVVTDPAGVELLIPAIPDCIRKVDMRARRMVVHLLPGLVEEKADGT